ncbi:hypothetical protein AB1N69_10585 [Pseudomonas asiatica]|uniref:hypothetical protein n=1 Tax=Pseudomonas asiatica TaxID=2219225 RepID=UPI0010C0BB07
MPTENRSSNTEMVSVPREWLNSVALLQMPLDQLQEQAVEFLCEPCDEPAEQHQGEPVAWYRESGGSKFLGFNPSHPDCQPIYTHADPGEVERLRAELSLRDRELEIAAEAHGEVQQERETLRVQLAALRELKLPEFLKLSDEMRAAGDHAEQRAREDQCYSVPVLKAVFFEAAIQRWLDDQEEALSASAEPSAPVDLDERAAFEKGYHKDALHRDGDEYSRMAVQMAWEGWQARAALDRKPS